MVMFVVQYCLLLSSVMSPQHFQGELSVQNLISLGLHCFLHQVHCNIVRKFVQTHFFLIVLILRFQIKNKKNIDLLYDSPFQPQSKKGHEAVYNKCYTLKHCIKQKVAVVRYNGASTRIEVSIISSCKTKYIPNFTFLFFCTWASICLESIFGIGKVCIDL